MSIKSTIAAAALVVATIGAGVATSTTEANAGYGYGYGYRHYSYVPSYSACRWVPKYNSYGYFIGNYRVCGYGHGY